MKQQKKNLICANLRALRHLRLLFLLGFLVAAAPEENKPSGFQGLGPLLGQAASIPPPPYKLKWTYKTDDAERVAIVGNPTIADGVVYIADSKGILHAVDLQSGKFKWKYPTENGFETTPLVAGNRIFLGDLAGTFHCVSTEGKKLWTIDAQSPIHSSANFIDNKVIFGTDGAEIYCLNVADGSQAWIGKSGDRVNSAPAIADGKTFVSGCDAQLRAIDIKTGNEVFAAELPALAPGSPACMSDRLIIGTDRGRVVAISSDGKKTLWSYEKIEGEALVQSTPAVADNIAVIGAHDRNIHAIDTNTGEQKWTFKTRGDVDAPPIISDGRVYVGSRDKHFYVLDLKTGQKLWEFTASRAIEGGAVISNNLVLFPDSAGNLYCFEPGK
jgi:outer membrane protein assembly factor BamB